MKTFEQQKKIAFTILLWIVSACVLFILWSLFYNKEWTLKTTLLSFLGIFFIILWMNKTYFSMSKAFYKVDYQWRSCNSRLSVLENIQSSIKKNPTLTNVYIEGWGYYDEATFKRHLFEEISKSTNKKEKLDKLLNEIKQTRETSFGAYIQQHLWR